MKVANISIIKGIIKRRFLLNFRLDPKVVEDILPAPFVPKTYNGYAIAGICLIRLENMHPKMMPINCGFSSENAAHRFAVQWQDEHGNLLSGVYIPRRDTNSLLNRLAGGRIFSGIQNKAYFDVKGNNNAYQFEMKSQDEKVFINFKGSISAEFPATSCFESLEQSSSFFEGGSLGYSKTDSQNTYDGIVLDAFDWKVKNFHIDECYSNYFMNEDQFPKGSVEFDHALIMEDIDHEWHRAQELCCKNE